MIKIIIIFEQQCTQFCCSDALLTEQAPRKDKNNNHHQEKSRVLISLPSLLCEVQCKVNQLLSHSFGRHWWAFNRPHCKVEQCEQCQWRDTSLQMSPVLAKTPWRWQDAVTVLGIPQILLFFSNFKILLSSLFFSPLSFTYHSSTSFPFRSFFVSHIYGKKLLSQTFMTNLPFLSLTEILQVFLSVLIFLLLTASFLLIFFFYSGFLSFVSFVIFTRHHFQTTFTFYHRCSFLFLYAWALL